MLDAGLRVIRIDARGYGASARATARVSGSESRSPSRRIGGHSVHGARQRCTRPRNNFV